MLEITGVLAEELVSMFTPSNFEFLSRKQLNLSDLLEIGHLTSNSETRIQIQSRIQMCLPPPPPLLVMVLDKLFGIQQYNDFPAPKHLSVLGSGYTGYSYTNLYFEAVIILSRFRERDTYKAVKSCLNVAVPFHCLDVLVENVSLGPLILFLNL